jgi:hypothetical protein
MNLKSIKFSERNQKREYMLCSFVQFETGKASLWVNRTRLALEIWDNKKELCGLMAVLHSWVLKTR